MMREAAQDNTARSVRLFENPVLERLSHSSATTIAVFWSTTSFAFVIAGCAAETVNPVEFIAALAATIVGWTVFEYCVHRFLFHLDTRFPWRWGHRLAFLLHGCHHVDPDDPTRDVMPLIGSTPAFFVLFAAANFVLPLPKALIEFGFIGFCYMTYDLTHYACHQWPMRSPLGRLIKSHHLRHHFGNPKRDFSVTAPFWDRVFGTAARP